MINIHMTFSTHSRKIDGINLGINGRILDTVDTYLETLKTVSSNPCLQYQVLHSER